MTEDCLIPWEALPRAHGEAPAGARWRVSPEDFQVDEVLGFEPSGSGQHRLLQVRKRGANTQWVAGQLARHAGVAPTAVGFSGLKDRHAVATQWFSIDLAGRPEPVWADLALEGVTVLAVHPHGRKLRRGSHRANRFTLVLRDLAGERDAVEARLERLAALGVPNYFGEQRFGREAANPARALAMLSGQRRVRDRQERGIYLSTARALVFNRVLAERVTAGTWAGLVPGDVLMLDGRGSRFPAPAAEPGLDARLARGEIHPSGPLWGRGPAETTGPAAALEARIAALCEPWCRGLEQAGLEADRRALRVCLPDLSRAWLDAETLRLHFTLATGSYATAVLRELVAIPGS